MCRDSLECSAGLQPEWSAGLQIECSAGLRPGYSAGLQPRKKESMTDRPRLIEVAFPLEQTSIDSVHEKLSLIHISEPTRLGMISYAVFCLKKKKKKSQ